MLVAGVVLGLLMGPSVLGRFAPERYDLMFVGSGDMTDLEQARAAYEQARADFDLGQSPEGQAVEEQTNQQIVALQMRIDKIKKQYAAVGDEDASTATARDEQIAPLLEEIEKAKQAFPLLLNDAQDAAMTRLQAPVKELEAQVMKRQAEHQAKLLGMATVMLLLVVMLHAAESILSPQRDEIEQGRAPLPPVLARLVTVRYGLASGWLMLMLAQPVWLRGIDLLFGGLLLAVVLLAGLIPLGKSPNTDTKAKS